MKKLKTTAKEPYFIGRVIEQQQLQSFAQLPKAAMIVVYGRRRIGKTELIQHCFRGDSLIKLEGLEGQAESIQFKHVLHQIAQYTQNTFIEKIQIANWVEMFELIFKIFCEKKCLLYFEEVQWLANYQDKFASALKYVWDNQFQHTAVKIILCGSSPSFMINQVIQSKALYNRALHQLHLKEFSVAETKQFLKTKSNQEVMNAYLAVGGIPEYLNRLCGKDSILMQLCKESFTENGFFTNEYQRIFISSFATNKNYKAVVAYLSQRRFATRLELASHLKIKSGGSLTAILYDLEQCGFIERYVPFQVEEESMLARYCIADAYLKFFYKFIKPLTKNIAHNEFVQEPTRALPMNTYQQWLGYTFENYCRHQAFLIAKILGFSALKYRSGVFFNRKTEKEAGGFQIDLIFERADDVYTICEIKYSRTKINTQVIAEMEKKLQLFSNPKNWPIQRVLIVNTGITAALEREHYFDRVITLEELIAAGER